MDLIYKPGIIRQKKKSGNIYKKTPIPKLEERKLNQAGEIKPSTLSNQIYLQLQKI